MAPPAEQIVTRPEELAACCEYLAAQGRFGLDTEFVGEDTYHPHLCLVQVATEERLFVIDPLSAGPLDAFWALVVDPARRVVVHAGREEARLCTLWAGRPPGNLFDLQIAAGLVGLQYPISHGNLVHQLLGVRLSKIETLTEWRDRPLTASQIRYALDDVRYLLPLCAKLDRLLDDLGRAEWAREEFARLAARSAPEEAAGPGERWRKLRGLGPLDRRQLAMIRELYRWREEAAARLNRPARIVCRDDLLVEIVRRDPSRPSDLQVIRGLARRDLDAILGALERARSLPREDWPAATERDQDPPQVALVTGILTAVLGDFCARHRLAPGLVANTHDLRQLVRRRLQGKPPPGADADDPSLLPRGWRGAHVLPELLAVLSGDSAVRVADVRSDSPLELFRR